MIDWPWTCAWCGSEFGAELGEVPSYCPHCGYRFISERTAIVAGEEYREGVELVSER